MPPLSEPLKRALNEAVEGATEPLETLNDIRAYLHEISPRKTQPIDHVRWVPIDKVQANDYNPNSVATNEMRLLYVSISHDGYTQPVVTVYDPELDKYVIVDGFHRYTTMRRNKDIYDLNGGYLPIVVIDKDINDRMAATIRHNRARGKHSVAGMGQIVFNMLRNGATDGQICAEVGLEPEELARLKYVTGFAKLFAETKYGQAWETDRQIKVRKGWLAENEHSEPQT